VRIHHLERETLQERLVESGVRQRTELWRSLLEKCFEAAPLDEAESNEIVSEASARLALTRECTCDLFSRDQLCCYKTLAEGHSENLLFIAT
jgi:hypothetical protein